MENVKFGFEELELWKKVLVLKKEIRMLTKTFPPEEKDRLTDQIIRSSRSINTQLSEGHGRFTFQINCISVFSPGDNYVKP